ncbi:hypothetical protein ACF0H5_013067 [Mactra antiquata]
MGIPRLWEMIKSKKEEFQETLGVPLSDLSGKTLAIDVSGWIVELQSQNHKAPNMHIRNLFFRTLGLLNAGVNLVAVFDGTAPDSKRATLIKRNKGGAGNVDRQQLRDKSKECAEVFKCLGVCCLTSSGEGEALCAFLEQKGKVDGCITSDSDYFCYGGKNVYRNLRKEKMFVVDSYSSVHSDYTHDDFIVFALMIGNDCDMKGTEGIGWKKTDEMIQHLKQLKVPSVLKRVLTWRDNQKLNAIDNKIENKPKKDSHCKHCDHPGTVVSHKSKGCTECDTSSDCNRNSNIRCDCPWHVVKYLEEDYKTELSVRRKALEKPDFPNSEVINEFRNLDKTIPKYLESGSIDAKAVIDCMARFGYTEDVTISSVIHSVILQDLWKKTDETNQMFSPIRIIRECTENRVKCYLVEWDKTGTCFINQRYKNHWTSSDSYEIKVELQLFKSKYPEIVKHFEDQKQSKDKKAPPKKPTKGKRNKDHDSVGQSTSAPPKKSLLESFNKVEKK